ncbi:sensor histidine kinase [Pseudacidovorax sp. RU35E]|uniref:sensor histidine kinase n=1 Tax=Pseudacidovorax sp. RU35E TaxID=1907403 RepID=UPI0009563679|nr:sensor histidine kinase [Pseudacidovorax sp. RU35E]SIR25106.1 two-component system, OmpR family, sensor histidine kinase TctE [Pseudacidovorax sp. RU35E]
MADRRASAPRRFAPTLRRQLLLWLLLPQLVLWLAGGLAAYQLAERYTNAAVDASLLQASRALARQLRPLDNGLLIDFPRAAQDVLEADPDDRLHYMVSTPPGAFILGNHQLPLPPAAVMARPPIGQPYFYDALLPPANDEVGTRQPLRVAALFLRQGGRDDPDAVLLVQVARSRTSREELARGILWDTLLPLAGLILLMTTVIWLGIRAGLAPLLRLRREVEGRAPTDLTPIRLDAAPGEVRALVMAVNGLLAAVQNNLAQQKRFISDAAHQMRTPLAGLKSQAEVALALAGDDAQRERLRRVHESADRSAQLVNQLLTLARAEPDTAAARGSPVDLRALAQELTATLVPRALREGIDLGFAPTEEDGGPQGEALPLIVTGHAWLLREALSNLIDNALRYAGRGAVVTVDVQRDGNEAVLSVTDDGPGIAPEDSSRVFERFVRATDQGNGCGLGLPIVKEIVERQGGRVTLASAIPHGLCARVHLPRAPLA